MELEKLIAYLLLPLIYLDMCYLSLCCSCKLNLISFPSLMSKFHKKDGTTLQ